MKKISTNQPKIGKSQFGGYYLVSPERYMGKKLTQEDMKKIYELQNEKSEVKGGE